MGALKRRAVQRWGGSEVVFAYASFFLPGAIAFWEKHGFSVMCVEEEKDGVWRTTHMEMLVGRDGG